MIELGGNEVAGDEWGILDANLEREDVRFVAAAFGPNDVRIFAREPGSSVHALLDRPFAEGAPAGSTWSPICVVLCASEPVLTGGSFPPCVGELLSPACYEPAGRVSGGFVAADCPQCSATTAVYDVSVPPVRPVCSACGASLLDVSFTRLLHYGVSVENGPIVFSAESRAQFTAREGIYRVYGPGGEGLPPHAS